MATVVGIVVCVGNPIAVQAQGSDDPVVWYRNDDLCPDAQSFLALLGQRGLQARLAVAGDPVDFVVTLGKVGDVSLGTLERQTRSGTIAIRNVRDERCEAVADALALSLALTHNPKAEGPASESAAVDPPTEGPLAAPAEREESQPAPSASGQQAARVPIERPTERAAAPRSFGDEKRAPQQRARESDDTSSQFALGAGAHFLDVFETAALAALGAFVEVRAARSRPGSVSSVLVTGGSGRIEAYGGRRSGGAPELWLTAARLEGCPVGVKLGVLGFYPCVALDLGAIGASAGGVHDRGWWSSGAAHGRFVLELDSVVFGVHAGALVPFRSYEIAAFGAETLDESRTAALAAGVNVSFGPL